MNRKITPVARELVTAWEAAEVLGVSRAHFYRMHNSGKIPHPVRLGGSVRWRLQELRAWIAAGMPNRREWNDRRTGGAA